MRTFNTISVLILALIAILQGVRFALGWPVSINGFVVPPWPSLVAFVVLGFVAVMLWREARVQSRQGPN